MDKIPLDIPLSIFAAGCIICLLSSLGSAWHIITSETEHVMYVFGSSIGLVGVIMGIIVFYRYKWKIKHSHQNEQE